MWLLLGIFLGWLFFAEPTIKGSGVILMNDQNQVLLIQNYKSAAWGFPKGHYEKQDGHWFQTAIREMEEETTFRYTEDYDILPGSCRYGKRIYYYGILTEKGKLKTPKINLAFPLEHLDIQWYDKQNLPEKLNYDLRDWIWEGMPNSCYQADDKFEL